MLERSENTISAVVHLDEETPHMHLVYIPVVHLKDSKSEKNINKISCYEFWKGKNSYRTWQNKLYDYNKENELENKKSEISNIPHIKTEKLKEITNYNQTKNKIKNLEEIKKYYEEYISTMYKTTRFKLVITKISPNKFILFFISSSSINNIIGNSCFL